MRLHTPLLTLTVLAVLASVGACERRRSEPADTLHVVPPPAVLAQAEPPAPAFRPAPPPAPTARPAAAAGDDAPSAEEVREFQRPVQK
jgi:hypothetical protein